MVSQRDIRIGKLALLRHPESQILMFVCFFFWRGGCNLVDRTGNSCFKKLAQGLQVMQRLASFFVVQK